MATCVRYTSYWNVLLVSIMLRFFDVKCQRPTEFELLLIIVSQWLDPKYSRKYYFTNSVAITKGSFTTAIY